MDQPTGETVALRALGALPDLDSVVFIRNQNRAFVTGRGPLATNAPLGARRFMRIGMWLFLVAGVVICLAVGVMEIIERQQRAALEGALRTVDAQVVGCANRLTNVPYLTYTVAGKAYRHYTPQTRADICDNRAWEVTYVAGNPDDWAVAPESPLKPFEDNIDAIWIVGGPCLLFLAAVYWLFSWFQTRRAGQEARLVKEGALIGAELQSIKWRGGGENSSPSLRVAFRMTLPDGRAVESKQSFTLFDLNHRTLPPEGSKLLVLRVDDTLQQVL
jgi:hypothetical protein